jgi:hypothetical protein
VLQAALQAAWAEILVETASSFHGLDSPSKAALTLSMGLSAVVDYGHIVVKSTLIYRIAKLVDNFHFHSQSFQ